MAKPFIVFHTDCWSDAVGGCIVRILQFSSRSAWNGYEQGESEEEGTVLAMDTTSPQEGGVFLEETGEIYDATLEQYVASLSRFVNACANHPKMQGSGENWTESVQDFSHNLHMDREKLAHFRAELAKGSALDVAFERWNELEATRHGW